MNEKKPLTVGHSTRATNPGRVSVNYFQWWRFFPRWPTIHTIMAIVWLVPAVAFSNFMLGIFGALAALFGILYFIRVKDHFQYGDANPGRVVSLNPTCIAVATNLRKGPGSYPVLKIVQIPLKKSLGKPLAIGDSVPTVALYGSSDPESPRWSDFYPHPVECATGSREQIESVEATFTEKDYAKLESALAQVPHKTPGLHLLFDEATSKPH
jgi:hypothetical protein